MTCYGQIEVWSHTTGGLLLCHWFSTVSSQRSNMLINMELKTHHLEVHVWKDSCLGITYFVYIYVRIYIYMYTHTVSTNGVALIVSKSPPFLLWDDIQKFDNGKVPRKAASIAAFWHASLPSSLCCHWLGQPTRLVETKLPGNQMIKWGPIDIAHQNVQELLVYSISS